MTVPSISLVHPDAEDLLVRARCPSLSGRAGGGGQRKVQGYRKLVARPLIVCTPAGLASQGLGADQTTLSLFVAPVAALRRLSCACSSSGPFHPRA